jgi:MurNAc alpha-1-phosphate uridylyltransferase
MLPLTEKTPKPLLKVAGEPLINHHLHTLARCGITEVIINTCYLGEQIVAEIGNGASFGLDVHYSVEEQLLETGGGIVKALSWLGTAPFLVISADIYTAFPLNTLPCEPKGLAHLVLVDNPNYKMQGDFGLDNDRVLINSSATYTYANIGVYRPEFFAKAPHSAFPLGQLLRQHVAAGLITGQYYTGLWHNVGTPEDLELVNTAAYDLRG